MNASDGCEAAVTAVGMMGEVQGMQGVAELKKVLT
mgnify:CR=1 FL=1